MNRLGSYLAIILTILLSILSQALEAQVITGNVTLNTQAAVDGMSGVTEVTGNLLIEGAAITHLDSLSSLEQVGGEFAIKLTAISTVDSLNRLKSVGGKLEFGANTNLSNLDGLDSVVTLGSFYCYGNSSLLHISGFNNLTRLYNTISIGNNDSLLDITGFANLDTIGSLQLYISQKAAVVIDWNNSLGTIDAFHSVKFVQGGIGIYYNNGLENLSIFENAEEVARYISILGNPILTSVEGFDSVVHIGGSVGIENNASLKNVDIFGKLATLEGGLLITGDSLMTIQQFPELKTVYDSSASACDLIIGGPLYQSSNVFPKLDSVQTNLELTTGAKILSEFPILKSIGGVTKVHGDSLEEIIGFEHAAYIYYLEFANLPFLKELPDFLSLKEVPYALYFKHLDSLVTLPDFPKLELVRRFSLEHNFSVEDVTGLSSIDPALTDGYYRVTYNPNLDLCCGLNKILIDDIVNGNANLVLFGNGSDCDQQGILNVGPCKIVNYTTSGNVFSDLNQNCLLDAGEPGMSQIIVKATPGSYVTITDSVGNYYMDMDPGSYQLSISPPFYLNGTGNASTFTKCTNTKSTVVDSLKAKTKVDDWGVEFNICPVVETFISGLWNRRCFAGNVYVDYENFGISDAQAAKLYVRIPSTLTVLSATPIPVSTSGNLLIFDLGTLTAGTSGGVHITTQSTCNSEDPLGLEGCIESWIEAANSCSPSVPAWSEASVELSSSCVNDSLVQFLVINEGTGAMLDSTPYRIFADTLLVSTGSLHLNSLDSLTLTVPSNDQTIRMEIDQVSNHPTNAMVSAAIEGCTVLPVEQASLGYITRYSTPVPIVNPSFSAECEPFIGSYDPNDKAVTPAGFDSTGLTLLDTRLRYKIRFQNTGTDTAFFVRIVDKLDANLDVTTLSVESASHPYTLTVTGTTNPKLTFLFSNILLPDSNINEPASHGYIVFSVSPVSGLLPQAEVKNFAKIYFDYNAAIVTNTALTTYTDSLPTSLDSNAISNIAYNKYVSYAADSFQIDESVLFHPLLSWALPSAAITDILIQRGTDSLQMSTIATLDKSSITYTDTLPLLGISYFYKVVTLSQNGLSFTPTLKVLQYSPRPLSPDSFQVDSSIPFYPAFTWKDIDVYEQGFLFQRSPDSLSFVTIDSLAENTTAYTDTIPLLGVDYFYRLIGYNKTGNSDSSSVLKVWQDIIPCPDSPELMLVSDSASWYPQLSWSDSCEYLSSFVINRGTDSTNLVFFESVPGQQKTFVDSSISKNTTYYYSVQSSNPQGVSPESEIVSFEVGALSIGSGEFPGLSVYPNPFSDVLVIEMPTFVGEVQITLINALGESVLEERVRMQNRHSLSTDALPAGTYMLIIQDSDHQSVKKVIHLQD